MRICSGLKTPPYEIRQLTLIDPYVTARTMTLPNWIGVRLLWLPRIVDYIYDNKVFFQISLPD